MGAQIQAHSTFQHRNFLLLEQFQQTNPSLKLGDAAHIHRLQHRQVMAEVIHVNKARIGFHFHRKVRFFITLGIYRHRFHLADSDRHAVVNQCGVRYFLVLELPEIGIFHCDFGD